jgi:hypothetical protein
MEAALTELLHNETTPTLETIKNCNSKLISDISKLVKEKDIEIVVNFIKKNIEYERMMNKKGYHTFYNALSLSAFINIRLNDYLFEYNFDKKSPNFYMLNDNAFDSENGKLRFNNILEFYQFYHEELEKKIVPQDKKKIIDNFLAAMDIDSHKVLELIKKRRIDISKITVDELSDIFITQSKLEEDEVVSSKFKDAPSMLPFFLSDIFEIQDSLDNYGSELNKYLYSVNNSLLGNSFNFQSSGESTLKFLLNFITSKFYNYLLKKDDIEKKLQNLQPILNKQLNKSTLTTNLSSDEKKKVLKTMLDAIQNNNDIINTIFIRISIKKECIPDHIILSHHFGLPLCSNVDKDNYDKYIKNTKGFLDSFDNIDKMREYYNDLKCCSSCTEYVDKSIREYENKLSDKCDLPSIVQSRLILTNKWFDDIKNKNVIISVLPCEVNESCEINSIINNFFIDSFDKSEFVKLPYGWEKRHQNYRNKYLKYKIKYLNLIKQKENPKY